MCHKVAKLPDLARRILVFRLFSPDEKSPDISWFLKFEITNKYKTEKEEYYHTIC